MAREKQTVQKGSISIQAQNIMPVIKRWLYSDKDIFLREIVSNGVDAIAKLKMLGEGGGEELKVVVSLDRKKGEIRVWDNGIGMTDEELENATEAFFTTKSEGTGLGLALSRQLVEENGGKLLLQSEKHSFTEATLLFERSLR